MKLALSICIFALGTYAKVYTTVTDLPCLSYDFVVVRGGIVGSVLVNRLIEKPDFSVLLLEAGVTNEGVVYFQAPFLVLDIEKHPIWSYNYTTTTQPGLGRRAIPYFRARAFLEGAATTHDLYASQQGGLGPLRGRSNLVLGSDVANERWTRPADGHDTRGQFGSRVHNTRYDIGEPHGFQLPRQCPRPSEEFPFILDSNAGTPLGVGWLQETIGGGERSTAAMLHLLPEVQKRPSFDILLNARVLRLLASKTNGVVDFDGEILLSAGSVGSPLILMHSGVGNATALAALGIQTLLDSPGVGQNALDHLVLSATWAVSGNDTFEISREPACFQEAFEEWNATKTGPFTAIGLTHIGWKRLSPKQLAPFEDPSADPNAPHIELMFTVRTEMIQDFIEHILTPSGHFFSIGVALVTPVSRGSVTLNSSSPLDAPIIDPALVADSFDAFAMREGIKMAEQFLAAPVWKGYILNPVGGLENATSDTALDEYVAALSGSSSHLSGTASMSARDASYGVVDTDLRAKGACGLRVIDASVLPRIPVGHTQAPTYAFAERGSDLVKAA